MSFHNTEWYKNDIRLAFDIFYLGKSASRVIGVKTDFDNKEETLAGNFMRISGTSESGFLKFEK